MIVKPGIYQEVIEAEDVALCFPNIVGKYKKTSNPTIKYNCLAWAVGANWAWFEPPNHLPGYYWPEGIEPEWNDAPIRKLLALFGYREETQDHTLESGYLKIAIYAHGDGIPTHFARQLPNGNWTSKLGDLIDVEHATLDCIAGDDPHYGTVRYFVKRKLGDNER